MRKLAVSLRFFYGIRKRKTSLRKLFFHPTKRVLRINKRAKTDAYLERRADVIFFRAFSFNSIRETRLFLKKKNCFIMTPKKKFKQIVVPYKQIPLFLFLMLKPHMAKKRKEFFERLFKARNKLFCIAPKWFYFSYIHMCGFLIKQPSLKIKYSFAKHNTLASFLGAARYL